MCARAYIIDKRGDMNMFSIIIAETTWYADVALIGVLLLFLLGGVIKGFGKSFKGFFATIVILLVSLLLMGAFHGSLMESSLSASLQDKIAAASADWGAEFNEHVYVNDGVYSILVDGAQTSLDSMGFKGKIANMLAKMLITESGVDSVAGVCVYNITSLIMAVCLFIACAIALTIICTVLKFAFKGFHESDSTVVRTVDRVLGGIVGLAVGAIIIFLVLAIFSALSDKAPSIINYIEQSSVCKFFYELNPIGKVFEKIFTKN